jgi:hypothetical protein
MVSFEFLVMPFGLCNFPTTFCTLMNDVFRSILGQVNGCLLDDIVVFSENMEDHKKHLVKVFEALEA